MIFSELYSAYYNAVAAILTELLRGERSERALQRTVAERAFGESVLTVLPAIKEGRWQLAHPDLSPAVRHVPTMPLTVLERRWLKAISLAPRFRLFGVEIPGLEGVEPLFTAEDYLVYDRYSDGDPFTDPEYIRQFRVILEAIREGGQVRFRLTDRRGRSHLVRCRPLRLEYSEKDDKLRLIASGWHATPSTFNLARISACERYTGEREARREVRQPPLAEVILRVRDVRNALERVMLHFAHFEKRVERTDGNTYRLYMKYDPDDATELVIRILSFGPFVEVIAPDAFRAQIVERLRRQLECDRLGEEN